MLLIAIGTCMAVGLASMAVLFFLVYYSGSQYFYIFATSLLFLLVGCSLLAPVFIWQELWAAPLVGASFAFFIGSLVFFLHGKEARYLEKMRQKRRRLKQPMNPYEVAQGIDWQEVEEWLSEQSRKH